ncbi:MAG: extracellular solute-binding protein [Xanthobacteraceae bacterium]|nr:MAG: extracellular solute-binding protein [Xanthobacteraceae bacterium]
MRTMFRPALIAGAFALAGALLTSASAMAQEKVLRIGMTAADIPRTHGQPDQGFEGNRFTGIPMYDALVHWDLSKADAASVIIPGLALSWQVDAADKNKWVFRLRPGVKFHDGSPFNAAAVVWNVQKVLDQNAPHFDQSQVGVTVSRMPNLASARAIDDLTVELTTKAPDSFLPINLTNLFMASPAHWQKLLSEVPASVADPKARAAAAWTAFASTPSGTGPFRGVRLVPRERFEMVPAGPRSTASFSCRCPSRTPAPPRSSPARSTGSRPRPRIRCPRSSSAASRSTPMPSLTSGPGSSPSARARRGSTAASATPPTSASTAPS